MTQPLRVVIDTSVLVAAARSRLGASFALISAIPSPLFKPCLSVSLYAEWQEVLTRAENLPPGRTSGDALAFLRYLAGQSHLQQVHFRWRPFLADPNDDMVLELAIASGARHIITHNLADFRGSAVMGVQAVAPGEFLRAIRKPT